MDRDKFDALMAASSKQFDDAMAVIKAKHDATQGPDEPAPAPAMQFGFDVVEVSRVNLQPGDVLMVTVKNDDLSQESVDGLRKQLQYVFPANKVFVFAMGTSDDINLSIVSEAVGKPVDCADPVSYCSNCNCGKKESANGT
jgi:hypothetical protein